MALQTSLNAFGLPSQPGFIDEKQPASPAKSPQTQQPDADRTLAPSPVSTKESGHDDDDEYPDGGARAWLIVLGVRLRVGWCGVKLTAFRPQTGALHGVCDVRSIHFLFFFRADARITCLPP